MIARVNDSASATYTFHIRQRLEDAQWEWVLKSSNNIELARCAKPYTRKSVAIAGIEKMKFAMKDGRVEIK